MPILARIIERQMRESHPLSSKFEQLKEGMIISFRRVPKGSWTSSNTAYRIEWKSRNEIYFRNIKTGGGTYDRDWQVNESEFILIVQ